MTPTTCGAGGHTASRRTWPRPAVTAATAPPAPAAAPAPKTGRSATTVAGPATGRRKGARRSPRHARGGMAVRRPLGVLLNAPATPHTAQRALSLRRKSLDKVVGIPTGYGTRLRLGVDPVDYSQATPSPSRSSPGRYPAYRPTRPPRRPVPRLSAPRLSAVSCARTCAICAARPRAVPRICEPSRLPAGRAARR